MVIKSYKMKEPYIILKEYADDIIMYTATQRNCSTGLKKIRGIFKFVYTGER
jgi:hypothetical protein